MKPGLWTRLKVWPQYLLPAHFLTALARRVSNCRWRWFSRLFIGVFVRAFAVDMSEAERDQVREYSCFDDFFTRRLKPGARPLPADEDSLICPADGTISALGRLTGGRLVQAKGVDYSAADLLGSARRAAAFDGGHFMTVYLAPRDYHRVHSPLAGRVVEEARIPGALFSVSEATTQVVPGLFCRNERMCAHIETARGPVAVVMVAAMLVAGIETVWGGADDLRPPHQKRTVPVDGFELARGAELGRFHWGSTVIVMTPAGFPAWRNDLRPGVKVKMGQALT